MRGCWFSRPTCPSPVTVSPRLLPSSSRDDGFLGCWPWPPRSGPVLPSYRTRWCLRWPRWPARILPRTVAAASPVPVALPCCACPCLSGLGLLRSLRPPSTLVMALTEVGRTPLPLPQGRAHAQVAGPAKPGSVPACACLCLRSLPVPQCRGAVRPPFFISRRRKDVTCFIFSLQF